MDCFDALPLSCVINNKFICMHGGINEELANKGISEINKINRF